MLTINLKDAKAGFSSLVDEAIKGEIVTITRHGKPVARLVPNTGRIDRSQAQAALQRIRERAQRSGAGRFDWAEVKALRDAGRR